MRERKVCEKSIKCDNRDGNVIIRSLVREES